MNSYIKKLQSKSESSRKNILYISLFSCMAVVVFVWVYSFGGIINNTQDNSTQANSGIKPFALFADSVSQTYQNITASAGNALSKEKSTEQPQKQIDLIPVEPPTNQ